MEVLTGSLVTIFGSQIGLGVLAVLLNLIEVIYLIRKRNHRTVFENCLLSLAFADFLTGATLISISSLMLHHPFILSDAHSRKLMAANQALISFSTIASLCHIIVIAIDRFAAVHYPFRHRTCFGEKRMTIILIFVWVIAAVIAVTCAFLLYWQHLKDISVMTVIKFRNIIMIIIIGLTISILTLAYILIVKKMLTRKKKVESLSDRQQDFQNNLEFRVTITSILITLSFFICVLPYISNMMLSKSPYMAIINISKKSADPISSKVSIFLFLSNALIDPLVYFLMPYIWKGILVLKARRKSPGNLDVQEE